MHREGIARRIAWRWQMAIPVRLSMTTIVALVIVSSDARCLPPLWASATSCPSSSYC